MNTDYSFVVFKTSINEGNEWVVEFPDLKGCCGVGDTIEEAVREGQENLKVYLYEMKELEYDIPEITQVELGVRFMTPKQKFDYRYVRSNLAVNCTTEELANEFLTLADSFGYRWNIGYKYTEHNSYKLKKELTCYNIKKGMFGSVKAFKQKGCKIIEYKGEKI